METSAREAIQQIKSGDNVFIHSVAAAPQVLIGAMMERASELRAVKLYHLHTEGPAPYAEPQYEENFRVKSLFVGSNVRQAVQEGRASYVPIFLSEIPHLFRKGIIPLDVALVSISPPDQHGMCSLGTSVDASKAAIQNARTVIAQVNKHVPRSHGDSFIHISQVDYHVPHDEPLPEVPTAEPGKVQQAIGQHVAELIPDRATLQMGIGAIPNAVLANLGNHKDLGIHTEMFSDGVLPLVEQGVITNKYKKKHPGKLVATFVMGTKKLYDFVDDNPEVAMLECDYVNDTAVIRRNPNVIAINSAIQIDLSGQVCADSIGKNMFSGIGGQMDFIRGASLSEGGKPIVALPSVTTKGISRIVPYLNQGAGVVTTRGHVQYVVTEYGKANLYGKTLKERTKELIRIAHPDHREELEKAAFEMYKGHVE